MTKILLNSLLGLIATICLMLAILTFGKTPIVEKLVKGVIAIQVENRINDLVAKIPDAQKFLSQAEESVKKFDVMLRESEERANIVDTKLEKIEAAAEIEEIDLGEKSPEAKKEGKGANVKVGIGGFLAKVKGKDGYVGVKMEKFKAKGQERLKDEREKINQAIVILRQKRDAAAAELASLSSDLGSAAQMNYGAKAKQEVLEICSCDYLPGQIKEKIALFEKVIVPSFSIASLAQIKNLNGNFTDIIQGAYFKVAQDIFGKLQVFSIINFVIFSGLIFLNVKMKSNPIMMTISFAAIAAFASIVTLIALNPKAVIMSSLGMTSSIFNWFTFWVVLFFIIDEVIFRWWITRKIGRIVDIIGDISIG